MKVLKLISENVKMIKAVEIIPDEHFQIISGRNEQGKSSVMDSIWYALGGAKAMEDTDEPIRRGEKQASVTLDLGDIVVTRKWSGSGTTLEIWTKATEILLELQEAQKVQKENDAKRSAFKELTNACQRFANDIDQLDVEIARLQAKRKELVKQSDEAEIKLLSDEVEIDLLEDPDLEAFNVRLQEVEKTNKAVREKLKRVEVSEKLAEAEEKSKNLTEQINGVDQQKKDLLQQTTFPIAGLGFGDNGLTFNEIPFKQCSAAQRLKVSMAMAMALNPEVRIIRIVNGNLLDSENLAVVKEMAEEKDFQVWIEWVDESGELGICIEDGLVKSNDNLPS